MYNPRNTWFVKMVFERSLVTTVSNILAIKTPFYELSPGHPSLPFQEEGESRLSADTDLVVGGPEAMEGEWSRFWGF